MFTPILGNDPFWQTYVSKWVGWNHQLEHMIHLKIWKFLEIPNLEIPITFKFHPFSLIKSAPEK